MYHPILKNYFLLGCLLLISFNSFADVIILKNGDRLSGTIKNKLGDKVLFESSYLGEVNIPWSEVVSLTSDKDLRIQLSDKVITGTSIKSEDGTIKLAADELFETKAIPLAEIAAINPPQHDGKVKLKGNANLGGAVYDGNTDRKSLHIDAELIARSLNNRITLGGAYNYGEDTGSESTNNAIVYSKYDHFFTEKWYGYANTTFETDKFQDLKLRSSLGGGMGYQFIENERTQLSLEGGVSYVNEDFISAASNSFAAGRWAFRFDHWLLVEMLQFFHHHEGLLSFDDVNDVYVRTRTGLRLPLFHGLAITAEVDVDYDNVPAPGNQETDTAYLLNIGYGF